MNKMAMLMNPAVVTRVFTPEAMARLKALTKELAIPEGPLQENPCDAGAVMRGADVLITSWTSPALTEEWLAPAPGLKLALHAAGSVKPVATDALWARGIPVVSSASVLSRGVAETGLGLTIMALKNIEEITWHTRTGDWWNNRADEVRGRIRELYGITIGVIGAGQAGRRYMELLRAFRVHVLLYDPTVSEQEAAELGARLVSLEELSASAALVMVLAPAIPETYHMINEERLSLMKQGTVLINLARGSLVDEAALRRRLDAGGFRAILDVTGQEPPPAGHWLRIHPHVTLTGHIAGSVNNGLLAIGDFIAEQAERFAAGHGLIGQIEPSRLHELA
ncbi:hydroxyacid dehydrogenase [Paenibacillus sp. 1011MAR3C5]|uniref:hydroxyacid dehydrogenase n=1 Tax=Paenibacillus sp. 1011MAR3C5 TaxID=1675787 RepID=UPI0016013A15|nr:hydroxyacid dehydrogenase [Paenibacillus sp. 1011MAR3C5]